MMKKEKFEKLTTKQLIQRKKLALILLVILIAAAVLSVSVLLKNLINGDDDTNYSLLSSAIACLVVSFPMYLGKKKIDEELKSRENK